MSVNSINGRKTLQTYKMTAYETCVISDILRKNTFGSLDGTSSLIPGKTLKVIKVTGTDKQDAVA